MYLYIYDNFLTAKKYQSQLYRIENRLVDLDIKGRVVRLNMLNNMADVVQSGIDQGVTTVVVVGDDRSFSKIINIIAHTDVVLGIIPIDRQSKIAAILGVPPAQGACAVIAQRMIRRIDLGMVGNYFFLDSAEIHNEETTVKFGKFNLTTTTEKNTVSFNNLGVLSHLAGSGKKIDPADGKLLLAANAPDGFLKKDQSTTFLSFQKAAVECAKPGAFIVVDQTVNLKPPAVIQIAPGQLKVIVGSKRLF